MFSYRRKMLYHEVWNGRLAAVADRYGLSEDQVREACRSFGVPLPTAKYWQSYDAGHNPKVRALSRFINRKTIDLGMESAADVEYWDWDLADPMFRDSFNVPPIYILPPLIFGNDRWSKIYENADTAGWSALEGSTPYDLYRNTEPPGSPGDCSEAIIDVDAGNGDFISWLRSKHIGLSGPLIGRLLLADLKYRCAERELTSPSRYARFRYVNAFAAVLGANDIECEIRMAIRPFPIGSDLLSKAIQVSADVP